MFSRTYFAVVGPIAASRARRIPLPLPDDGGVFPADIEKCFRNAGMTCPAAEGEKRTIHHGSSPSLSKIIVGASFSPPARDDVISRYKKAITYLVPLATRAQDCSQSPESHALRTP